MATFKITSADSVLTTAASAHAFNQDNTGPDTFIVDPGAYLIATGTNAFGAYLGNQGRWNATINGSIISQQHDGLILGGSFADGSSVVTIGNETSIYGGRFGLHIAGPATIKNAGEIVGNGASGAGIFLGDSNAHVIVNSGTISGTHAIWAVSFSSDKVTNSGIINGNIDLDVGADTLTNSGQITGNIDLGDYADKLANAGRISGDVIAGFGNDTVTNFVGARHGTIVGIINLGYGDDVFNGGKFTETVRDWSGSDTVNLGAGNDIYLATGEPATDGNDKVNGGAGIDLYDASAATSEVLINFGNVARDGIAAATATGTNVAPGATDKVAGFENATTGSANDIVHGSDFANVLDGGEGNDDLFGYGGNDTLIGDGGRDTLTGGTGNDSLIGGAGVDILNGGTGKDLLTGGDGSDTFIFAAGDTGITRATRDVIADFNQSVDWIDLRAIDANSRNGAAVNDAFHYINTDPHGALFSGTAGELRSYWTATGHIIEGDVNGDARADLAIEVLDPMHAISFSDTYFLL